ncbi:MAG: ABC transporter permease [Bilifractor sp.]|jgi:ABC-2 type transport system permease protein
MPVFKAFFKILKAKSGIVLIYIAVNAIFMLLFAGQAQQTGETMFAETGIDVAVYDRSESTLSEEAISLLEEQNNVDVFHEGDLDEAGDTEKDRLRYLNNDVRGGIYDYVLIVPEDFASNRKYNYIATTESSAGYIINEQLDSFLECVSVDESLGMDTDTAIQKASETMMEADNADITIVETAGNNGSSHGRLYYGFLFMCWSLMMAIVIGISTVLSGMNQENVTARINCSALPLRKAGFSKFAASIVYACAVTAVFVLMALSYSVGDPEMEKIGYFILNMIPVVIMSSAFAYFLTALTRDESIINMVSNMTSLGMCFISGVFVTQSMMSEKVLRVAQFTPFFWYVKGIDIIEGTAVGQAPGAALTECILIQLLFGGAFFAAGTVASAVKK